MKTSFINKAKLFTTAMTVFAVALIATQSPVGAVNAKLAQANQQQDATATLQKLNQELTRRTTELGKSTTALNGAKGATATETDAAECAADDKELKAAIDKVNKDSTKATNDTNKLLSDIKQTKDAATAKQKAVEADSKYDEYKAANIQNNIMNTTCTQKGGQKQLEEMIEQVTARYNECFSNDINLEDNETWAGLKAGEKPTEKSKAAAKAQAEANSNDSDKTPAEGCPANSGQGGSGGGGGGEGGNMQEMIAKIIQIVAAIAAIIASIVALVMAIQAGDFAAAAAIGMTIIGQLATVAELIIGGEGEITGMLGSLGISAGEGEAAA